MEYTLRSGKVVTDEQIEAMAEAIEAGSLPGQWSVSYTPLITV